MQLPSEANPRFGERRSPSNVQDWLELHDLFDVADNLSPAPVPVQRSRSTRRRESMQSAYSTARSESSHRRLQQQQQQSRLLSHVDIFQRQNSFIARSERSSVGSIVRNFPPIRAESYRTAQTTVSASTECSPRRSKQQLQRQHKRQRYLHYVDLALGDDNCESQEENLLQSVSTFLEVKREFEGANRRPRALPVLQLSPDTADEVDPDAQLAVPAPPERPKRKRRAPKAAPSTIPESTDTLSNGATFRDSLEFRRNSCA